MRRLKTMVSVLAVVMLAGLVPVSTVVAADPEPSSVDLAGPASIQVGDEAVLTAAVNAPVGYETDATITFTSIAGGGADCVGVALDLLGTACHLTGLAVGSHTYTATYSGNSGVLGSTSNDFGFDVTAIPPPDPESSTTTLVGPGSIVVGTAATLSATVAAPPGYDGDGATMNFHAISGGGPECLAMAVLNTGTVCDLGDTLPVGTYVYEAVYSGNATTLGSTSEQVTFVVTAEPDTTLDASDVTRDYSTFYPAKDSYKDKLTISGIRDEPITVTIKIYAPTGKKVKTKVIALGAGSYRYQWFGRSSSGKLLKAGKYKIVQTLRDPAGNSLVVTKSTKLSHKKLVKKTTYVTKKGLSITAGSSGNIWISKSRGYAKLKGSSSAPAMAGYSFTIPKATRYKSLSFQIYAKGPKSAPKSEIGMQNMAACPDLSGDWYIGCFDQAESWSSSSAKWHSTSGSPTNNRKGTKVRGVILSTHGTVIVYKVRVKVTYQVLR